MPRYILVLVPEVAILQDIDTYCPFKNHNLVDIIGQAEEQLIIGYTGLAKPIPNIHYRAYPYYFSGADAGNLDAYQLIELQEYTFISLLDGRSFNLYDNAIVDQNNRSVLHSFSSGTMANAKKCLIIDNDEKKNIGQIIRIFRIYVLTETDLIVLVMMDMLDYVQNYGAINALDSFPL
jgi:hypothetical protein